LLLGFPVIVIPPFDTELISLNMQKFAERFCFLSLLLAFLLLPYCGAEEVNFNRDIRPFLSPPTIQRV
jgi:hypothetical protein